MEQGKNELQQATDNRAQSIPADAGGEPSAEQERRARVFNRDLATVGLYLSGAYLAFLLLMGGLVWDRLWQMQPNEFGDLMAGVFAPLAFLWLVLGFFQQGAELRNSATALWLQMDELRNSVEQQKGLVEATREPPSAKFSSERMPSGRGPPNQSSGLHLQVSRRSEATPSFMNSDTP